jgi:hypothetical protein
MSLSLHWANEFLHARMIRFCTAAKPTKIPMENGGLVSHSVDFDEKNAWAICL